MDVLICTIRCESVRIWVDLCGSVRNYMTRCYSACVYLYGSAWICTSLCELIPNLSGSVWICTKLHGSVLILMYLYGSLLICTRPVAKEGGGHYRGPCPLSRAKPVFCYFSRKIGLVPSLGGGGSQKGTKLLWKNSADEILIKGLVLVMLQW